MNSAEPIERSGFTVVELIVAMSISAVTLLSGYELFQALKRAGDAQDEDLSAVATSLYALDRLREDLLHAVPRPGSQELVFVGQDPASKGSAQTTSPLEFYTLCAGNDRPFGGLRQMERVRYDLVKARGSMYLCRSATPVAGAGRMPPGEAREPILDRVERMKVVFHDGRTIEPQFSSKESLPVRVDLAVTAHGRVWPLSVKLPCGDPQE